MHSIRLKTAGGCDAFNDSIDDAKFPFNLNAFPVTFPILQSVSNSSMPLEVSAPSRGLLVLVAVIKHDDND